MNRIAHTTAFVTPVVEQWLEREIAQWVHPMKDRSDDPSYHERTFLPRSYISLLVKKSNIKWPTPSVFRSQRLTDYGAQNVDDRPRSCRPRATTWLQDRFICNKVLGNRSQIANQILAFLHQANSVRVTKLFSCSPSSCSTDEGCAYLDKWPHCSQTWMVKGASELGISSLVTCRVFRWVTIHFGPPWEAWSCLAIKKWTVRNRHNAISWRWMCYGVGWYHYNW